MAEALREIVLPETKPETEWLRGRAVQKVSPLRPAFTPASVVDTDARRLG